MRSRIKFKVQSLKLGFAALSIMFAMLLIGSCNSGAKKSAPADLTTDAGRAKLVFLEEIHHFGSLKAGEVVSFTFIFRNEGTKALTITRVDRGCECTEVKIKDKSIEPGQEGHMEVIYNSAGEVGKQLKTISIFSNAEEPEKQIFIKATITNEYIEIYS